MGRRLLAALAVIASFVAAGPAAAAAPHHGGEVVVRFRASADAAERAAVRQRLDARVEDSLPEHRLQLLELEPGLSVKRAAAALERSPEVLYAEPNFRVVPDAATNDPQYGGQWGLHKINAAEAWDITTGNTDTTVAVIDSGVEVRHPDLAGSGPADSNLWTNAGETGGGRETNDVDDDGNGYVDDWRGWNWGASGPYEDPSDPTDFDGHGTYAAGVIGAIGNNGAGISGINQRVRIMPLRWWDAGSFGAARAIAYADREGVRVANGSFGIGYSQAIEDALAAAPNLLLVVSAGNQSWDVETHKEWRYPCVSTRPNVICVAATDPNDNLAEFSNWGAESVDLGAPGTDLLTLALPRRFGWRDDFSAELDGRWVTGGTNNTWARVSENPEWPTSYNGWALHDSPGEHYENDTDSWVAMAQSMDLTGHTGCTLSYAATHDLAEGDVLRVEGSTDHGATWTKLGELSRGVYNSQHSLAAVEDRAGVRIRFRLVTNDGWQARGVRIDDLGIWCRWAPFRGDEYVRVGGTSYAAPHVSGVAGLVLSKRPWLSTAQLRAALLDNVEPVPSLAGRTVTGGRLNALWALNGRPAPEPGGGIEEDSPGAAAPVADERPPRCSMTRSRAQGPRSLRRRGLRVLVRCDEAAALVARLRARGLRIAAASTRLAEPGKQALRLRARGSRARALSRRARLRVRLRLSARDAAGNAGSLTRRFVLRAQ